MDPQQEQNEFPGVEESFGFTCFEKYILNSSQNFNLLNECIRSLDLSALGIRFNVWRIFLGIFTPNSTDQEKKDAIQKERQAYQELVDKYSPQKQQTNNPLKPKPVFNPLAKNLPSVNNGGTQQEDNELFFEIKIDVERTHQERELFTKAKSRSILTNVLFYFSKKHSDVSYKQGMNEVAASFLIIYLQEALYIQKNINQPQFSERSKEMAGLLMDFSYIEADIYGVFCKMMEIGHLEMFRPNLSESQKKKQESNVNSKRQQAILLRISKIQDHHLRTVDLELFKHLKMLNVEFQIFLLRWIRCVHTREFHLEDSFLIWDNIFLEYFASNQPEKEFFLIDCMCLSMISYLRFQILEKEEHSDCLSRLLKFPPVENLKVIIDQAFRFKEIIEEKGNTQDSSASTIVAEDKSVVKQKIQGNKNLVLFSSGFTNKSSNISISKQEVLIPVKQSSSPVKEVSKLPDPITKTHQKLVPQLLTTNQLNQQKEQNQLQSDATLLSKQQKHVSNGGPLLIPSQADLTVQKQRLISSQTLLKASNSNSSPPPNEKLEILQKMSAPSSTLNIISQQPVTTQIIASSKKPSEIVDVKVSDLQEIDERVTRALEALVSASIREGNSEEKNKVIEELQAVSKTLKHITPKQSNSLASQANNNAASIKKARPILFKEEENRIVED